MLPTLKRTITKSTLYLVEGTCQDQFFADLIFRGVRGSGHGLAVRPKGYVVESRFPKGRKADQGFKTESPRLFGQ